MALFRRDELNEIPLPDTTSVGDLPHPTPTANSTGQPGTAPIPNSFSRSAYVTSEGIVLPISTIGEGEAMYVNETGQPYSSLSTSGLSTYFSSDNAFVRSTTGTYMSPTSLFANYSMAGDYVGASFSPDQIKQIYTNPTYLYMFTSGSLTDQYYLSGVGKAPSNQPGTQSQASLNSHLKSTAIQAERAVKGTAQKVADIKKRLGIKNTPVQSKYNPPKTPVRTSNYSAAPGYTGNTSKRYSI